MVRSEVGFKKTIKQLLEWCSKNRIDRQTLFYYFKKDACVEVDSPGAHVKLTTALQSQCLIMI